MNYIYTFLFFTRMKTWWDPCSSLKMWFREAPPEEERNKTERETECKGDFTFKYIFAIFHWILGEYDGLRGMGVCGLCFPLSIQTLSYIQCCFLLVFWEIASPESTLIQPRKTTYVWNALCILWQVVMINILLPYEKKSHSQTFFICLTLELRTLHLVYWNCIQEELQPPLLAFFAKKACMRKKKQQMYSLWVAWK